MDVANLLGTRLETVSRWNLGKAFPRSDAERTLLDLEYLVELLSDIYQPEEARLWFYLRQKLLGGVALADMIRRKNSGADYCRRSIARRSACLAHCIFPPAIHAGELLDRLGDLSTCDFNGEVFPGPRAQILIR